MNTLHLTKAELARLRIEHRRCKDKRLAYRINAIVLLGQGWTYSQVAEALLVDEDTLRNYVWKFTKGGLKELLIDHYQGNEGRLSGPELVELDEHLLEYVYQGAEQIVEYIEKTYGISYTVSGVTALLHRLNYSYKKPKKVPGKADEQKQREFLKKYYKVRENMRKEDGLYFIDGSHPQHNSVTAYGWIKKGIEKQLLSNTIYRRLNIHGALNIDTLQVHARFEKRLDEEAVLDMLESLRKRQREGTIYIVLDNAGYYCTKRVKAYAKGLGIKLLYLPPYSPNLNIIERLWNYFQKRVMHNRYYDSYDKFRTRSRQFFNELWRHKDELRTLMTENFQIISV
jgi:transposase